MCTIKYIKFCIGKNLKSKEKTLMASYILADKIYDVLSSYVAYNKYTYQNRKQLCVHVHIDQNIQIS